MQCDHGIKKRFHPFRLGVTALYRFILRSGQHVRALTSELPRPENESLHKGSLRSRVIHRESQSIQHIHGFWMLMWFQYQIRL